MNNDHLMQSFLYFNYDYSFYRGIDAIECPKCHQPLRPSEVRRVPVFYNHVAKLKLGFICSTMGEFLYSGNNDRSSSVDIPVQSFLFPKYFTICTSYRSCLLSVQIDIIVYMR